MYFNYVYRCRLTVYVFGLKEIRQPKKVSAFKRSKNNKLQGVLLRTRALGNAFISWITCNVIHVAIDTDGKNCRVRFNTSHNELHYCNNQASYTVLH